MKWRTIVFGFILIVCIVAVNFGIYWQFMREESESAGKTNEVETNSEELVSNFSNIFTNSINYQNYSVSGISKVDNTEELVYTQTQIDETLENQYDLYVSIPYININSSIIQNCNEEIKSTFKDKADDILTGTTAEAIYTVEYVGYVNSNIFSLVIKSTLKVGNNAQRVIVKTYNYNLTTDELTNLSSIISIRGLTSSTVNEKIKATVKKAAEDASKLQELGYNVYNRDLNSSIYSIENTTEFFLGENRILYVLYPYGNSNYTSEIDIIVF